MANVLLAWPNLIQSAALSNGSWLAALPLDNVKTSVISQVARTVDARNKSTVLQMDFGQSAALQCVAVVNHNLSQSARIRISASSFADMATLNYESEWAKVWSSVFYTTDLEWESSNYWGGSIADEDIGSSTPVFLFTFDEIKYGQYWKIEFDDVTNSSGYIEIGRVFASKAWRPAFNLSYGASVYWNPYFDVTMSLGGSKYFSPKSSTRRMKFSLNFLTKAEAYQKAFEMQRALGADGELLVALDTDDQSTFQQLSFVARLASMGELKIASFGQYSIEVDVEEVI